LITIKVEPVRVRVCFLHLAHLSVPEATNYFVHLSVQKVKREESLKNYTFRPAAETVSQIMSYCDFLTTS
jgi:hypothetical protein